ncbi:hypothetical protein Trydic_g13242 [Trypoxylus dichotomus]
MSINFIPTRGSKRRNIEEIDFNFTIHQSYKPKKRQTLCDVEDEKSKKAIPETVNEIDMKRARFEVIKFGMSGFDKQRKEKAKVQLAVKLGAKPPKQKYKNYKVILKTKKIEKNQEAKLKQKQQQPKAQNMKISTFKKDIDKKRKQEKGILNIYGKVKGTRA